MKKIRQFTKRGTAVLLAVMLFMLAGCGSGNTTKDSGAAGTEGGSKEGTYDNNAKGRYMESDMALPEGLTQLLDMKKLEDGSIVFMDRDKGAFVSRDNGETWEQKDTCLQAYMGWDAYSYNAVIGKDGSYFARYYEGEGTDGPQDDEIEGFDVAENGEAAFFASSDFFKLAYVDKNGNAAQIIPQLEENDFIDSIGILSDGTPLISIEDKVFKINPSTGELTRLCEAEGNVMYMEQIGNLLYLVGATIQEYDLEAETFVEDPVLEEFAAERLKASMFNYDGGGTKPILLCEGDEENSIYVGCSDGLYRHVIGGNIMEEVIKGSLTSLGDPSLSLCHLVKTGNNEFLIGYAQGLPMSCLLKKYAYDSEAFAVPEQTLEIYSLTNNESIKQAISEYQKNHSDVYVQYEVGLSEESGMTKEDAIRNLNTRLLSGEGPDLILLDGMPVESYIEKGILADLSGMLSEDFGQDTFFEKMINIYEKDGKIYAVPSRFQIPIVYGEKSAVEKITDLTTLADTVEKLREEKETGSILGNYNEKETIERLYDVNSPAWVSQEGTIKKEELTAFLTEAKRIYEAEQKGISEAAIKAHQEEVAFSTEYMGEDYYLSAGNSAMSSYLTGDTQIGCGRSSCVSITSVDYSVITSVLKKKGGDWQIKLLPGQKGNVFIPKSIVGVCENSTSKELAMSFISELLSENVQNTAPETGYPVNRQAFSASLVNPQEEDHEENGMYYSMAKEDGEVVDLDVTWINEEEKKQLEEMAASLDTPSVIDETIREAVLQLAPAALNGEKSVEDVTNEIINKVQIYLSE